MKTPLPIDESLPAIVAAVAATRSAVVVAPPGAGKTTRVPTAVLDSGLLDPAHGRLVLLQPRRVAARMVAARIASENGWTVGEEVGYQIRFERRVGPRTRLRVLTEGLLLRRLLADPFLDGVGAVILDEFHERSLDSDLALALLREVRDAVRPDLILLVMSATLDPAPVQAFLGGCPAIRAEGRSFPVAITYRGANDGRRPLSEQVAGAVVAAVDEAGDEPGDVLAFLPGFDEIRRAGRSLSSWADTTGALVLPLHGSLTVDEQDRALRPVPGGRRKVILATNIAETSLTVDGVTTVIDGGRSRISSHDPVRGLDRLELKRISRASADQRAGRAGRTRPGRCIRLWTEREHRGLDPSDRPEIARLDLAAAVLALHAWGQSDPSRFGWYETPPASSLTAAEDLLGMLGALDPTHRAITPIGRLILELPTHPRLGRLLVAAADGGFLAEGAAVAAILAEKDLAVPGGLGTAPLPASSDVLDRLDRLRDAERLRFTPGLRDRGIDPHTARQVARVRDELLRAGGRLPGANRRVEPTEDDLLRLVLLAYPDRVCRRRGGDGSTGVMVGGRGVRLDPTSVVRAGEFFVAVDPREDRRGGTLEARVRVASAVDPAWLDELAADAIRRERTVRYDPERRRAVGRVAWTYRDLVIREDVHVAVEPEEATRALAEYLLPRARSVFESDPAAASWLLRLDLARRLLPERGWPEFDDNAWTKMLAEACRGRRSEDDIQRGTLPHLLQNRLTYAENRTLDDLVPETITVPTGNRIRLEYRPDGPPILAIRVQELFGLAETPRVAGGRLPVLLHLLGPNYRPVQVTDDLASFWRTTYFQVRKDLRARYPRHSWPDDPTTARPESKGGRRSAPG